MNAPVLALAGLTLAAAPAAAAPSIGLDHVVVVVRDLDAAARDFRALGFTLKPGRPHANGIRNVHAKFADGTEVELLTVPERPRDALTRRYRRFLAGGDGPAALALFAPAEAPRESLEHVFFGRRNHSPTDRPAHFAHRNGARSLIGVWLAGGDLAAERRLLARLGATFRRETRELPETIEVETARLAGGEILLLGGPRPAGRALLGVTLEVRDLDETRAVLRGSNTAVRETRAALHIESHGLRIEFRERAR